MAQRPQLRRDELELLGDLLADALERGPVLRAALLGFREIVEDLDAGNPIREWLAAALSARVRRHRGLFGSFVLVGTVFSELGFIEQPHLLVRALLAPAPEAMLLEQADVLAEDPKLIGLRVDQLMLPKRIVAKRFEVAGKPEESS